MKITDSQAEIAQKGMLFNRERAYAVMQAREVDGIVGARPVNAYYLSGAKPFSLISGLRWSASSRSEET